MNFHVTIVLVSMIEERTKDLAQINFKGKRGVD